MRPLSSQFRSVVVSFLLLLLLLLRHEHKAAMLSEEKSTKFVKPSFSCYSAFMWVRHCIGVVLAVVDVVRVVDVNAVAERQVNYHPSLTIISAGLVFSNCCRRRLFSRCSQCCCNGKDW